MILFLDGSRSDVLSRVATTPKPAADPRAVRVLPSHSPTPAQRAARHTLTRQSATTAMRRNSELIADDLCDPGPGMAAVGESWRRQDDSIAH